MPYSRQFAWEKTIRENPVFAVFRNFLGKNGLSIFIVKYPILQEKMLRKNGFYMGYFTDGLKKGKIPHVKSSKPA